MAYDPNDKETKAALKAAADEAVTEAVEEAVSGLKAKNTELLGKLKKAQKDATIDPADHAALQAELDTNEVTLAKAVKDLKTATTESEKVKKQYESESKVAHNLLVDNGLTTALLKIGVKDPELQEAARFMFSGRATLEVDGEKRIAKIDGKPLEEFIKEWGASPKAVKFIDAPVNLGGNAPGGDGNLDNDALTKIKDPNVRLTAINNQEVAAA